MLENLRFALKLVLDGAANVDSAAYHTEVFAARSVHSVEALLQLLPDARCKNGSVQVRHVVELLGSHLCVI